MDDAFIDLRRNADAGAGGDTFWPSFTDIMMVIVMIFMIASTVLVLRNWDLVQELRATIEAEHLAEELARSMTETSATLEEQLAQAQHINSRMRMQLMQADENRQSMQEQLADQGKQLLALTEKQQQLTASLQQSRRSDQRNADRLAKVSNELANTSSELAKVRAEYEQLTTTHANLQERQLQALDELAASEQTSSEQALELAKLRQGYSLSTRQMDTLKGEYNELRVKYDKLIRPARSAKGKHVVTVRYRKENGQYLLRIRDAGETDYSVVSRKELYRRLAKLKDDHSGNLYVKLIIPDDSGLSYTEAWTFTMDVLDKYDYYHQE
jgi:chromosome segregation ATPase